MKGLRMAAMLWDFQEKDTWYGKEWTIPRRGSDLNQKLSDAQAVVWIILQSKRRHQKDFNQKSTPK